MTANHKKHYNKLRRQSSDHPTLVSRRLRAIQATMAYFSWKGRQPDVFLRTVKKIIKKVKIWGILTVCVFQHEPRVVAG